MSLFTILFIVVPEVLADVSATADRREKLRDRKEVTGNHVKTATLLQTMWDFEVAKIVASLDDNFTYDHIMLTPGRHTNFSAVLRVLWGRREHRLFKLQVAVGLFSCLHCSAGLQFLRDSEKVRENPRMNCMGSWEISFRMAENARRSKMTASKTEHYSFSWKVFTMWDYTIGNSETAANTVAANNTKLKVKKCPM